MHSFSMISTFIFFLGMNVFETEMCLHIKQMMELYWSDRSSSMLPVQQYQTHLMSKQYEKQCLIWLIKVIVVTFALLSELLQDVSLLNEAIISVITGYLNRTDMPWCTVTTMQLKATQIFFYQTERCNFMKIWLFSRLIQGLKRDLRVYLS